MNIPEYDSERTLLGELEQELQQTLQEFEMPRGFADRVVRRVENRNRERNWWRTGIAAAVLIGASLGGEMIDAHYKMEHRRAEVQREFNTAMHVTNKSMNAIHRALKKLDKTNDEGEAE